MRERHTQQKTISLQEICIIKWRKHRFDVSFAEVIRECVTRELDKLIGRKNRKQSQKNL